MKKAAGAALRDVELQGVEPWSKQGIPKLSTCLCCYWFSYSARKQPS